MELNKEWQKEAERIENEGLHSEDYYLTLSKSEGYLQGAQSYSNAVEAEINNKIEHIDKILEKVQSELLKIQLVAARTELFILLEKLTNLTPTTNE